MLNSVPINISIDLVCARAAWINSYGNWKLISRLANRMRDRVCGCENDGIWRSNQQRLLFTCKSLRLWLRFKAAHRKPWNSEQQQRNMFNNNEIQFGKHGERDRRHGMRLRKHMRIVYFVCEQIYYLKLKRKTKKKPRNNLEQPQRDRLCNRFELWFSEERNFLQKKNEINENEKNALTRLMTSYYFVKGIILASYCNLIAARSLHSSFGELN